MQNHLIILMVVFPSFGRCFQQYEIFSRSMAEHGEPYIPASESPLELTVRVVIVGILLGILMFGFLVTSALCHNFVELLQEINEGDEADEASKNDLKS